MFILCVVRCSKRVALNTVALLTTSRAASTVRFPIRTKLRAVTANSALSPSPDRSSASPGSGGRHDRLSSSVPIELTALTATSAASTAWSTSCRSAAFRSPNSRLASSSCCR